MNYKRYFAIEKRLHANGFKSSRSELVESFTEGKKSGLKELTEWEYAEFLRWLTIPLKESNQVPKSIKGTPEDKMRKKIIALFIHQMGYDMERLNQWCVRHGVFHKKLNDHKYSELVRLVSQAEEVYKSFKKSLNK